MAVRALAEERRPSFKVTSDAQIEHDYRVTGQALTQNRLNRVVRDRLQEVKVLTEKAYRNLQSVEEALPEGSSERRTLQEFRQYSESIRKNILPDLIEFHVATANARWMLEGIARDLDQRLTELERSFLVRCARWLSRLLTKPKRQATPEVLQATSLNVYANVENRNTPFELFSDWNSVFHFQGRSYGSNTPRVSDAAQSFADADTIIGFQGKRILELGCLEAANTKELIDLGAREVIAIEANREAFLKALIVKNEFYLDNVHFLYGDCNAILASPEFERQKWFDVCLAFGILYHMEDPLLTLDLITSSAPVLFIWTQVASEESPLGPWTDLQDADQRVYQARKNIYQSAQHLGGIGSFAYWLTEESLLRALADRGFEILTLEHSKTGSGDAINFIAKRKDVLLRSQ